MRVFAFHLADDVYSTDRLPGKKTRQITHYFIMVAVRTPRTPGAGPRGSQGARWGWIEKHLKGLFHCNHQIEVLHISIFHRICKRIE